MSDLQLESLLPRRQACDYEHLTISSRQSEHVRVPVADPTARYSGEAHSGLFELGFVF